MQFKVRKTFGIKAATETVHRRFTHVRHFRQCSNAGMNSGLW
ncbi:Uncharacterised protein [Vibrio cholerae]|nr:Uncharacterised protein [Vibrio cholerae]